MMLSKAWNLISKSCPTGRMIYEHFADSNNERSVATRLRRKRFQVFLAMLPYNTGPVSVLDIGGTPQYWNMMTVDLALDKPLHITLLNTQAISTASLHFTALVGDGRAMPQFGDAQFDIVFSNSTLEHVGTFADQRRMADEVRRVGHNYYVQTPNRYFPIEPHFVFPFFQFLPLFQRVWLVQHFNLGWYSRISDPQAAMREVTRVRLLSRGEFAQLFPEATILDEQYGGLVKSFVAYTSRMS